MSSESDYNSSPSPARDKTAKRQTERSRSRDKEYKERPDVKTT